MSRLPAFGWLFSPRRFVPRRAIQAAQAFVRIEASSGIVLLIAAIVALAWANSPWAEAYFDLWDTRIVLDLSVIRIDEDLRHWINDGLMTFFFFLVGLEIKRERVHGELASARRALLPMAAALGGMVAPALIYTAFNSGGDGHNGWGIPMATDIAFALGVLSLLSGRIPFGIKVFLLALAIADDIGAILVIAFFYTSDVDADALVVAGAVFCVIVAMNRLGVRSLNGYIVAGVALWLALYEAGVTPTMTGVILGLLTRAVEYYTPDTFAASAAGLVNRYSDALENAAIDERQSILAQIEDLSQGTEAPLDRLERRLHPWVSYGIVPIFALANAGVAISSDVAGAAVESPVTLGVLLGLVVGKPIGIFLFSWLVIRLRLCELPNGASWAHIAGVGLLAGIGFTVSLLITGLPFEDPALIDEAKLGVLAASVVSGLMGLTFLWLTARRLNGRAS
jgi:NhaA family Na+:H+ antiporter